MVRFHYPTPIPTPIPMKCTKAPLGPIPTQKLQWKLVKFHLISTNISAKVGTVAFGIRIGIRIGIVLGSVETVLHIIIGPNFIGIGVGLGIVGIGKREVEAHH